MSELVEPEESPATIQQLATQTHDGRRLGRLAAWVIIPPIGTWWAARHLKQMWFYYDEWSVIAHVVELPARHAMFRSFNGHLWMLQYLVYDAQVSWFGLDSHAFVTVVFLVSLYALHLSIAALLRAAGLPTLIALLLGGLLTYLGAAAQNWLFVIQLSPTFAAAVCIAAGALALQPPSKWSMTLVGLALLVSVGVDSGSALTGIAMTTVIVVATWRSRKALVVLPSVVALAVWLVVADLGPSWPGTIGTRVEFMYHLLLASAGAIIGLGETAGGVLLLSSALVITIGFVRGSVTHRARVMLLAGGVATAITLGALAQSRAALVDNNFFNFNRYLQNVAIPLTLCLAPAISATVAALIPNPIRSSGRFVRGVLAFTLPVALVGVAFYSGLEPLWAYAYGFGRSTVYVHESAMSAVIILRDGCPNGEPPGPNSLPAGDVSPQMPTDLLRILIARGALSTPPSARDVNPESLARMCPTP